MNEIELRKYLKYRSSPKHKETIARYRTTDGYKATQEKYRASDKYKSAGERYSKSNKGQSSRRAAQLKFKYRISEKDFERMFRSQNGACAICESVSLSGKRLHIDHNHVTGKVRGLLCQPCNHMIGNAKEAMIILYKAADYLEKHR